MGREDLSAFITLKARIAEALKEESENGTHDTRLSTLRLIMCAIGDRDICARGRGVGEGCPEADVRGVLETMVAQRIESAREHEAEGRFEESIREREEIDVIRQFLPVPLSGKALEIVVREVADDIGAAKLKDLGRCMTELKARYPGQIDPAIAGKTVRAVLST